MLVYVGTIASRRLIRNTLRMAFPDDISYRPISNSCASDEMIGYYIPPLADIGRVPEAPSMR